MSTVVVVGRMPRHLTLENLALRQSLARSPRSGHGKRQPDSTTERGARPTGDRSVFIEILSAWLLD